MKSHFLPVFFLRGFTLSYPKKKGKLFEFNLKTAEQLGPRPPKQFAYVSNLYKSELGPEEDPDDIEHFLDQHIESPAASVCWNIYKNKRVPTGAARSHLMLFVASLGARVPFVKDLTRAILDREFKAPLLTKTETTERFDELVARSGLEVPDELREPVRENIRRTLTQGHPSNNVFLEQMLRATLSLFLFLEPRALQLLIADDTAPNLVCPDVPVRFIPRREDIDSRDIGVRMAGSTLVFRLNRRMVLLAGPPGPDNVRPMTADEVRAINRIALDSCFRAYKYVYSAEPDFEYSGNQGSVYTKRDLVQRIR
jgi:hypothetical protein